MAADILLRSVLIGVGFGGILAIPYWWFRRGDPKAAGQAGMVFISLAVLMAVRFYFTH